MGNFIDRTFTIIADFILKLLPTSKKEKQAFSYYRAGMAAQSKGRYAEALKNYFESLQLEEDAYDRSYSLYNIGLIYGNMGKKRVALEFYHQAIALNSNLPQALNNIGVIYHSEAIRANCFAQTINQLESEIIDVDKYETYSEMSKELFDKAGDYWMEALLLAPDNYPGARNWLKITGRIYKLLED